MQRALSLDNSPPASMPLRFMFSAPVFVALAGLLLAWAGPDALASRWTPQALALTHLLALGALAHTMTGALMQILPVATGSHVLAPRLTATIAHLGLAGGTLLLAGGFLAGEPWLFGTAVALLGASISWLVAASAGGLWRHRRHATRGSSEILAGVRLALLSLAITLATGAILAGHPALGQPSPRAYTDLHGAWGLMGWVGLLIIAMSHQLVPMFQVTELYPSGMTRRLTGGIFMLLLAQTANTMLLRSPALELAAGLLLAAAFLLYAGVTLDLLRRRKRPAPDTTTLFWRTGLASLAACVPAWVAQRALGLDLAPTLGVLFIVGFAWSIINGMLYTIIPFLVWFHCQRGLPMALPFIPKARHVITDVQARRQFRAHLAALALLVAASIWPGHFARAGGLALALSALWLFASMLGALRLLVTTRKRVRDVLAAGRRPAAQAE